MILAGAGGSGLAKSIFQDLKTDIIYPITQFPGYEETTIVSPDGKLGLTMTTRFSLKTSSYILGIMPRPFSALVIGNMNMFTYMHGVMKVRKTGIGNIGPAAINIEESLTNSNYMGYDLHSIGLLVPLCHGTLIPKEQYFQRFHLITKKEYVLLDLIIINHQKA